ncbi:MAG TPA: L,D-transpeptidase family protein [Dehalococcoidia bacterium]|nr:L,D-transpeptidase family protein [Dehalococcoidia bacterium]
MRPRALAVLALCLLLPFAAACSSGSPAPTATPAATDTPTPAAPTPTSTPAPTPTPPVGVGTAIVVGGDLRVRSAPSTSGPVVATLKDQARVTIDRAVQGEDVLVGSQTWVSSPPPWTRTWYRLSDGTYVYAAFIFILQPGEVSPLADPQGQEKWVDVNVTTQTARAMVGARAVYSAPVSSGSAGFPTPLGSHVIEKDGRLPVERMTAAQAGYNPSQATYDVENVLFTQYFDRKGDALHLNYWRPASVFGHEPTSHGCVGMQLHDAQYFWLFGAPGMRVEIHT